MAMLHPYPAPLGLFPGFIARQTEMLVIKEKVMSFSGDSFTIKMGNGQPIFQVNGNAFSLSGRKEVLDMSGKHLFTIRKRHLAIHSTYYAEDPAGNQIFEVVGKFSIGSSKSVGRFTNPQTGQQEELSMKGDFFNTSAEIHGTAIATPVAVIDRKFLNTNELLFGQQTYAVTIAPNVDMALIAAMCICLDERRSES